ncbi:hypothetical protein BH11PSE10_BH11PSE10_07250 [soil metagenome]
MTSCPLPRNEAERLAAVHAYKILDTAPEVEFDVTTRVAASLFDAPIALVALMDRDRLWFKSRHGLDVAQLDREIAFCAHAILRPEKLLVINDLQQDTRFADNPLVHGGPGIRFYAGAPLRDPNGLALGTLAILSTEPREFDAHNQALLRDLSVSVMTAIESRHRALTLRQMATTDALTGLANRIQFQSALALELRQAQQAGQPIAALYLDLDGFKGVNDSLGHGAGDAVLREVAQRLSAQMRHGETLARMGGDEFAIVMRGGADLHAAQALAERIVTALRQPVTLRGGEQVPVGVSIGIAVQDAGTVDIAGLIEQADHALYKAKSQVAQRWAMFDDPTQPVLVVPQSSFAALTEAEISTTRCEGCGEGVTQPFPFTMAFQPIVKASNRTVFAYEALVRGLGGESASTVLARVTRRNRYAFDQSCRRTAIDLAARLGIVERGVCLSINFIPGAMYEPENCVRATLAAARRAQLPADRLIFEVTEGEEVLEPSHLAKIFDVYRRHGFRPAIDDFGAGYAGLNLLAEFQPSIIKLDRKLIQDIDASRPKQAIVRGVLSVCIDLAITPIAEGVETEAEYRTLRALGVDLFQGYLFARPGFEALPEPTFPDA